MSLQDRREILGRFGAEGAVADALSAYNRPPEWDPVAAAECLQSGTTLPEEPCVSTWRDWADQAAETGVLATLCRYLPQLNFPIRTGIGEEAAYRAATRRGQSWRENPLATGRDWRNPAGFELHIEATIGGPVAVITIAERDDFERVIQALLHRNEPTPIPASMGATMIAGYTNWSRLHAWQAAWERANPDGLFALQGMPVLRPQKALYQDRFIILSRARYSNVPDGVLADDQGVLEGDRFLACSQVLRAQHEMTHYAVLRRFGYMRHNMHDELVCDYMAICAAAGRFRPEWFATFIGLEDFPRYRRGARLENYRGDLSDGAFNVLARLLHAAAANLAVVDAEAYAGWDGQAGRTAMVHALASLSLEALAATDGVDRLREQLAYWQAMTPAAS